MAEAKFTAVFCGWEGYRLGAVGRPDNDPSLVWIELLPDPDRVLICSGCGAVADAVHDTVERWVRDLPMFDAQTHLLAYGFRDDDYFFLKIRSAFPGNTG